MPSSESAPPRSSQADSANRQFVTCRACGWVHYAMTPEEKAASDRFLERYQLSEKERFLYESAFRQCLRCESPAGEFRAAEENDLARAVGHLLTPVLVEAEAGE